MRIVLCNISPGKAIGLAQTLVEEGLAACVNVLPVRSVYRWEGRLEVEEEETMIIKVGAERVGALRERIVELHPYQVPEVVVLDVEAWQSFGPYVEWVREQTRPEEGR